MADEEEKNVEEAQVPETEVSEGGGDDGIPAHSPDSENQAQNVRGDTDAPAADADAAQADEATADESAQADEAAADADAGQADEGAADESAQADSSDASEEAKAATPAPPAEPDPLDDLPRKERERILKSRKPHKARPERSGEERQAERDAERKRKAAQRAKRRAEAKAEAEKGGAGTPPAERESNQAKVRQGVVVSNKADKTITVRIDTARRHRVYEKIVRQSRTLHAHDERNEASEGDTVRVIETRPLSKTKRWRLVEIVEKAR